MARVTVEDCIKKVPNRFELVLIAAARSRQLATGHGRSILVDRDNDRDPVVALREIAEEKIKPAEMHEKIILDSFRHIVSDDKVNGDNEKDDMNMSEEDMLRRLEALESEGSDLNFNADSNINEDIGGNRDIGQAADSELNFSGSENKLDEAIGDIVDEGEEIGKAAIDESFEPSEDKEEDVMADIEIDEDEVIGEAIENDGYTKDDEVVG